MTALKNNKIISIILIVYNEEERIGDLLKVYSEFADTILLDNFSDDRTCEIATRYGAKVIQRQKKGQPTAQDFINAANAASCDWLHFGTCSELLPAELIRCIKEIIEKNDTSIKAIKVNRVSYTFGLWTHISDPGRLDSANIIGYSFRFIRKGYIDWSRSAIHMEWPGKVEPHEVVEVSPENGAFILHFRTGNPSSTEIKHAEYADIEARLKWERGERFSWLKLILSPMYQFLTLFLKRPTAAGCIVALQHAQLIMNIHIRLWVFTIAGGSLDPEAANKNIRGRHLALLAQTFGGASA